MSHSTREWLKRTPPEQALDILAKIAEDAQPDRQSFLQYFLTLLLASFATSDGLNPKAVARRVGTRAAMMLADRDDPRCLPPLVRVFELNIMRQSNYQARIEKSLLRYLSNVVEQEGGVAALRPYEEDLRTLVTRIWRDGRKELSPVLTEMLIVTLRSLAEIGGAANIALIATLANATPTKPNLRRVHELANCLHVRP